LDVVLGLRKFFHDRTMTDLGSRTDRRLPHMWGDKGKTQWQVGTRRRDDGGRCARCSKMGGSSGRLPIQALFRRALTAAAGLSGLTRGKSVFVARNQPADRALATMEKRSSEEP
jgi:hypothetical protein